MKLSFSSTPREEIPDAFIIQKGNFPKECSEAVSLMEKRGRLDFSKNKFLVMETEKKTIALAVMGEDLQQNDSAQIKNFFGDYIHFCKKEGLTELNLFVENLDHAMLFNLSEALILGEYSFKKGKNSETPLDITIVCDNLLSDEVETMEKGKLFGNILCDVRDMVNTTSDVMTPINFVKKAEELLKDTDVKIEILEKEQLQKLNFKAMLSVSQGAKEAPTAIIIRYMGDKENPENITALLGKGITFDSGGLSLKSKKGMITMHHDMAGAAAVIGAMKIIAMEKQEKNVVGMALLCENMLSEYAYRPGDIIDTMNGKTVLINSTDAEGRLILADGLCYLINNEKVSRIVDIATLTGGVVSALGDKITGFVSNDDSMAEKLIESGLKIGEPVWRMPLAKEYKEKLKANQADLANSTLGDGPAMIIAALFLNEFVEDIPWLHIDCAGTAWTGKEYGRFSFGSTSVGSEMLADFVKNF